MAHLLEDIADSFKYFRGLRNGNKKIAKKIKESLESGDYGVFDARLLPEEINKIKEIKNENGI